MAHLVIVGVFAALFAIAGVAYMVSTSAATKKTGKILIDARHPVGETRADQSESSAARKSSAHLNVYAFQDSKCNGKKFKYGTNFKTRRTLKCTAGTYKLSLVNGQGFVGRTGNSWRQEHHYKAETRVELEAGETVRVHLGTSGGSRERPH